MKKQTIISKSNCKGLQNTIFDVCKERHDNTKGCHTLTEWCSVFFQPEYEKQYITEENYDHLVYRLLFAVERIDKEAAALYQYTALTTTNSNITSEFRESIHKLQTCAYRTYTTSRRIPMDDDSLSEEGILLYSLIEKNIKTLIVDICNAFPELHDEFLNQRHCLPPDPEPSSWGEKI